MANDTKTSVKAPVPKTGKTIGGFKHVAKWPQNEVAITKPVRGKLFFPSCRSSAVKTMGVCRRRLFYAERLGLRRQNAWKSALEIGSIFHLLSACLRRGMTLEKSIAECTLRHAKQKDATIRDAGSLGILPNGQTIEQWVSKADEDFHKALAMAVTYFRKFPVDPRRFKVLDVEKEITTRFDLPPALEPYRECLGWPKGGVVLRGVLDTVLEEVETGHLWIDDHKTTSDLPTQLMASMEYDIQVMVYRLLALAAYPERRIVGFIHNVVQKPDITLCRLDRDKIVQRKVIAKGPRKGQEVEEVEYVGEPKFQNYMARMLAWYEEKGGDWQHPAVPMAQHEKRFLDNYPTLDSLRLMAECWTLLQVPAGRINMVAHYPRVSNYYTCNSGIFGGPCEYRELCRHGDNMGLVSLDVQTRYTQSHRDYETKETIL